MRDSASKSKVERGWGRLLMLTSGSHMHTHTHTCTQDHIYMFSKAKQQQQQKLQQCGEADWAHLYPRVPFPHWQDSSLLLYFWIFGCLILQPVWFLLSSQGVSHSCVYLFDDCSRNLLLLRTLLGVGDTNIHSDRSLSWETSASSACWRFDSTCNRLFLAGAVFSPLSQVCSKEDSVCLDRCLLQRDAVHPMMGTRLQMGARACTSTWVCSRGEGNLRRRS